MNARAPEDRHEHPWLGLRPYGESDEAIFHGRASEVQDLLALLRRNLLTVVFGASGTGKTSLINAGVIPALRGGDFLPVAVRLDYSEAAQAPAALVKQLVRAAAETAKLEISFQGPEGADEASMTLWEWFHRLELWNARNDLVEPVLFLDQFEEVFTVGHGTAHARGFLGELADLVENNLPERVRESLASEGRRLDFDASRPQVKVLLAMREDYVARLDELRGLMPSVMDARLPLRPLNGEQALDVILGPGAHIVDAPTARQIVAFAAATTKRGGVQRQGVTQDEEDDLRMLRVEPALLSMICRELNQRRLDARADKITPGQLEQSKGRILATFYRRALEGFPKRSQHFVEDRLLTESGYRRSVPVEDAHQQGLDEKQIGTLVGRRLLRIEDRMSRPHVELTHDLLAGVVQESRDQRRSGRRRLSMLLAVAGVLVMGGLTALFFKMAVDAEAAADEAAASEARAQQNYEAAQAVVRSIETMADRSPDLQGLAMRRARLQIYRETRAFYEQFHDAEEQDPQVLMAQANATVDVAELEAAVGDPERSVEAFRAAKSVLARASELTTSLDAAGRDRLVRLHARTRAGLGPVLLQLGDAGSASTELESALAYLHRIAAPDEGDDRLRGITRFRLGLGHEAAGETDAAEEAFGASRLALEAACEGDCAPESRDAFLLLLAHLSARSLAQDDHAEALALAREAKQQAQRSAAGSRRRNEAHRRAVAGTHFRLAQLLYRLQDDEQAWEEMRAADEAYAVLVALPDATASDALDAVRARRLRAEYKIDASAEIGFENVLEDVRGMLEGLAADLPTEVPALGGAVLQERAEILRAQAANEVTFGLDETALVQLAQSEDLISQLLEREDAELSSIFLFQGQLAYWRARAHRNLDNAKGAAAADQDQEEIFRSLVESSEAETLAEASARLGRFHHDRAGLLWGEDESGNRERVKADLVEASRLLATAAGADPGNLRHHALRTVIEADRLIAAGWRDAVDAFDVLRGDAQPLLEIARAVEAGWQKMRATSPHMQAYADAELLAQRQQLALLRLIGDEEGLARARARHLDAWFAWLVDALGAPLPDETQRRDRARALAARTSAHVILRTVLAPTFEPSFVRTAPTAELVAHVAALDAVLLPALGGAGRLEAAATLSEAHRMLESHLPPEEARDDLESVREALLAALDARHEVSVPLALLVAKEAYALQRANRAAEVGALLVSVVQAIESAPAAVGPGAAEDASAESLLEMREVRKISALSLLLEAAARPEVALPPEALEGYLLAFDARVGTLLESTEPDSLYLHYEEIAPLEEAISRLRTLAADVGPAPLSTAAYFEYWRDDIDVAEVYCDEALMLLGEHPRWTARLENERAAYGAYAQSDPGGPGLAGPTPSLSYVGSARGDDWITWSDTSGKVGVYDVAAAREVGRYTGLEEAVWWAAVTPDKSLVVATCGDGALRAWDIVDGEVVWQHALVHAEGTMCGAFLGDDRLVTCGKDGYFRVWRLSDGEALHAWHVAESSWYWIEFNPAGNVLAAGSDSGKVYLWRLEDADAGTFELARTYAYTDKTAYCVSWSPDGTRLLVGHAQGIALLDPTAETPEAFVDASTDLISVSFHPDGERVVSAGGQLDIWRLPDLEAVAVGPEGTMFAMVRARTPTLIAAASEGRLLASNGVGQGHIWDTLLSVSPVQAATPPDEVPSPEEARRTPLGD